MFTKILVAIDNFTDSQPVFEQALELAKLTDARLMVLHVLSAQDQDYPALQSNALEAYQQQWHHFKAHSLKQLRSLAQQAAAAGITTEVSQTFGDPGNGICDLSRTWKADLIIVGSRDRFDVSSLLSNSVSNYVKHNAQCSVLTIIQPEHRNGASNHHIPEHNAHD